MKQKRFLLLLLLEACCAIALYLFQFSQYQLMTTLLAFPWEPLGIGLRTLSLSGSAGNIAAWILYMIVCLLPAGLLLPLRKHRLYPEDLILALITVCLFFVLYWMINPALLPFMAGGETVGKAICGGTILSLLLAWVVLRIMRRFASAEKEQLHRDLYRLLCCVCFFFVFVIFGVNFGALLDSIQALHAGNHVNGKPAAGLEATYIFLALQYVFDSLPYVLDLILCFTGMSLLRHIQEQTDQLPALIARFRLFCMYGLAATVLTTAVFNMLQLAFASKLHVINGQLQIPVLSVLFVLAALLLTGYMQENKQLKDDNDLFI